MYEQCIVEWWSVNWLIQLCPWRWCHVDLAPLYHSPLQLLSCRYLGEVRLLTTACCIKELESLGSAVYGALMITKGFPIYKCGHKTSLPASQCILSLLGERNTEHLVVATQDSSLR